MIDGDFFDKIEEIARVLRKSTLPFGGIQLILTGDFFQLPPVASDGRKPVFLFDSKSWKTSVDHVISLTQVFRQKDPEFAGMLNDMRKGRLEANSIAKFASLHRELAPSKDGIVATELFSTRDEVDRANNRRMLDLEGMTYQFDSRDGGTMPPGEARAKLLRSFIAPARLSLKIGAQVMLVKNLDDRLVNGSIGKVVGFMTEREFKQYRNKDQHLTDGVATESDDETVLGDMFGASGKAGLSANGASFPIVRFRGPDNKPQCIIVTREDFKMETITGEIELSRIQIPLILAWALSIHKAQGQTIDRVRVDMARVFDCGQAYVALSRATSMAGLQLINFHPRKIMAHPKVTDFYAALADGAGKK